MKRQRAIGVFVLGSLLLLSIGLALFGAGRWFRDATVVMMTFEGDVKGLNVGSRVTFRGVQIGTVSSLSLHMEPNGGVTIPVLAEIDVTKAFTNNHLGRGELLKQFLQKGLKARLVSESLVTGLLQIQLEFFPEQKGFVMQDAEQFPYVQIPTVPTAFEKATYKLERLMESMEKLPLENIVLSLDGALSALNRHLNSVELQNTLTQFSEATTHLNALLTELDKNKDALTQQIKDSMQGVQGMTRDVSTLAERGQHLTVTLEAFVTRIDQTLNRLDGTLAQTSQTLQAYQNLAKPDAQLQQQLLQSLRSFEAASQQFRQLGETLQRNPESILTGKQH